MMKQKQKTLGERLFDPRWLSNQGDARRDFKEPPVGLDLARALAARQLDSCDLGEKDKAEVASALDEEDRRSLQDFLDGLRTEPPASLVAQSTPTAGAAPRAMDERDVSLRGRCADVLAWIGRESRWVAAAGVLLAGGVVVATWFAVARSRAPGSEDRPAWASAMIAAAVPSDGLATWGGEEQRSLTRYLEPPGLTTNSSRYIDPRVVAVRLDDGTFQSGTAIGPRLVVTVVATGLGRPARVYERDGEEWVERTGELRTELGIGLATLVVVDGAPFESWFDPAAWSEAELSVQQVDADGSPIDRSVGCYGLGGSEGGVLLSSNGRDRDADVLLFTDCTMRPGLGGGALARLVEGDLELLGIVVGSKTDGAVAVSAAAVRQQLFSEADRDPVSSDEG